MSASVIKGHVTVVSGWTWPRSWLVSALQRVRANFDAAVRGTPVRDMAETLAECDAALAAFEVDR